MGAGSRPLRLHQDVEWAIAAARNRPTTCSSCSRAPSPNRQATRRSPAARPSALSLVMSQFGATGRREARARLMLTHDDVREILRIIDESDLRSYGRTPVSLRVRREGCVAMRTPALLASAWEGGRFIPGPPPDTRRRTRRTVWSRSRARCSAPSTAPSPQDLIRSWRPRSEGRARHHRLHHRGDEDDELGLPGSRGRSRRSCRPTGSWSSTERRCSGCALSRRPAGMKRVFIPNRGEIACASSRRAASSTSSAWSAARTPTATACGTAGRPGGVPRTGPGRPELPARRRRRAGRARHRVRRHPSGLRVPVREPASGTFSPSTASCSWGRRPRRSSSPATSWRRAPRPSGPGCRCCPEEKWAASRGAQAGGRNGYPVLVKAAAGGGGRGIRRVRTDELEELVGLARGEAVSAFADDGVYVERLVERPATSRCKSRPTRAAGWSNSVSVTARCSAGIRR